MKSPFYSFEMNDTQGRLNSFENFKNQPLLIVNVASQCGFTKQYSELESLYKKYQDQGFLILGFPCNQFGQQEPGSDQDIQQFCSLNFGVSFPIFKKIEVNGKNTPPLYNWLKSEAPGFLGIKSIKWNFTKFLIGKDGQVLKRYAPQKKPLEIERDIQAALQEPL